MNTEYIYEKLDIDTTLKELSKYLNDDVLFFKQADEFIPVLHAIMLFTLYPDIYRRIEKPYRWIINDHRGVETTTIGLYTKTDVYSQFNKDDIVGFIVEVK